MDESSLLEDPFVIRRLIGKLIYLNVTRPHITFAIRCMSQFMDKYRKSHLEASYKLLRYLKNAPGHGIMIFKNKPLELKAYCDANWVACPLTRRSVTSYCIFLGDTLISLNSKKQKTISKSLVEAKYRSLAHVTREI